jgi:quinohemoprotein ethanol dehydrogenase
MLMAKPHTVNTTGKLRAALSNKIAALVLCVPGIVWAQERPPAVPLLAATARAAAPNAGAGNWSTLGRDAQQDYFSPLKSIDARNITRLGFAWAYDLGTNRGQEATPIVIDGVMYTSGYVGFTYAVDAATGKEIWRFDPHVSYPPLRNACCDAINRGVAVFKGRVYVASIDGRLHALNATTGREIWSVDTIVDHTLPYSSAGAPIVAHDVVVIGNGGGDMGHGGVRGYVSAYDLNSGGLKWRFFTVPPAPGKPFEHPELALAAKTWAPGRDPIYAGGATVWDGMTYDPTLNLLYFGTGNAAPADVRKLGPGNGDMLFACSILAINPDSGSMVWYYQPTPGDRWDFDAVQKLVLADLKIDGHLRQVIMQANKNGFFYVLDRSSGQLISAKKFSYVTWASDVDIKNGRPILTDRANYYDKPSDVYPSTLGAHSWEPMSFDPLTRLVYIPVIDMSNVLYDLETSADPFRYVNGEFTVNQVFVEDGYGSEGADSALPALKALQAERPDGHLMRELIRAWDPVAHKVVWEHEASSLGQLRMDGGILSTAGNLVFQGHGDGTLTVYAADTGKELKSIQTGRHLMAAPITYTVNGVQYVAIETGFGGTLIGLGFPASSVASKYDNENKILAFKLDGGAVPMPVPRESESVIPPPASTADPAQIKQGEIKYIQECARCHAFVPGLTPDLRNLPLAIHESFKDIVLKGTLAPAGMEKFDDLLSEAEVEAIHAYLIDQQKQLFEAQRTPH